MANKNNASRRHKNVLKENDTTDYKVSEDLKSVAECLYQTVFLLENTVNSARYLDIFKDAVNELYLDCDSYADDNSHNCDVIVVDHNRLIGALCEEKVQDIDEAYRAVRERAEAELFDNGQISTGLMVRLVHHAVSTALRAWRQKWCGGDSVVEPRPAVTVVLTGFFDLEFVIEFVNLVRVDAVIELRCGEIARVRDKFVSRAYKAERSAADQTVRRFWRDLRHRLDTDPDVAFAFKDVPIHVHKSKYNAYNEPPDFDAIVTLAKSHVMREIRQLIQFLFDARTEHKQFVEDAKPVYSLSSVDDDDDRGGLVAPHYESYVELLSEYPEQVVTIPVVLEAMVGAIDPERQRLSADWSWVDVRFDALESDLTMDEDVCMANYPVCVPYGNECAIAVRKYDLRFTADYWRSALHALNVRWKKFLWALRPLLPLAIEAKYNDIVSDVKSLSKTGSDLDMQLCVLGLNRLQSNLDLYLGESIYLPGLGVTQVKFKPELIEPIGCTTMVQVLEKESEIHENVSYAYFEPEDVMLVGFYDDFQGGVPTRKSSFSFNVPQPAIGVKDYFDFFHRKKIPKCFYALDSALCSTYREEAENVRFRNGDRLTIIQRKWRFEPKTVCLKYKSKRYELVRHVVSDDGDEDDRCRILTNTGHEYAIEKSHENVLRFTCKTADGKIIEIDSAGKRATICQRLLRQFSGANGRVEECRYYAPNGCVVIEFSDKTSVTYLGSGVQVVGTAMDDAFVVSAISAEELDSKSPLASSTQTDFAVEYLRDGVRMTVEFEDGTKISTCVREVLPQPKGLSSDWVCYTVFEYKYAHPAYLTVMVDDQNGTFRVSDVVSRGSPDGCIRLRVHDKLLADVTEEAIMVVGCNGGGGGGSSKGPEIATFGWKGCRSGFLFKKTDGARDVTTVNEHDLSTSRTITMASVTPNPTYFVVKRNMSGFRVLERGQYDEYVKEMLKRIHTVVHENRDDIVMLFTEDDENR